MKEITQERIKELIQEHNITQQALSQEINITGATLSRNLNGVHEPKADVIKKIADYFDVSIDYLLGNTDVKKQNDPLKDLGSIDIALYNATKELNENEKNEILDYINYIKTKNKS